jgi:hypothetical protein
MARTFRQYRAHLCQIESNATVAQHLGTIDEPAAIKGGSGRAATSQSERQPEHAQKHTKTRHHKNYTRTLAVVRGETIDNNPNTMLSLKAYFLLAIVLVSMIMRGYAAPDEYDDQAVDWLASDQDASNQAELELQDDDELAANWNYADDLGEDEMVVKQYGRGCPRNRRGNGFGRK